jgi:hypothetical protein
VADTHEPAVPLLADPAARRAEDLADVYRRLYVDIPELQRPGLQVNFALDERSPASVALTVKVKDFTGAVVYERTLTGDRRLGGGFRFDF